LNWIKDISSRKTGKLHLLATSRDEEDIAERLQSLDPHNVLMKSEDVNTDIEKYVNHMLQTDEGLGQWDPDVQAKIKSSLMESADGMYAFPICTHPQTMLICGLGFDWFRYS
jgi:hypothetical protein